MLSDNEIVSILGAKIRRALNQDGGDISAVRIENLDYYLGKPFGNERDGYSKVVTREAFETVEWALPSILRVFLSGDQVVSYDPVGPEDEAEAEQQTDIANHYLLKENNGFLALHHWVKDCLLYPNGYIGLWIDEQAKTRVEKYEGISAQGLQMAMTTLARKGDVEVIEHSSQTVDTDQGPLETFDVRIRVSWKDKKPRIEAVPPDELLVDSDCLSIDLDEADMVARRVKKSYSQLVREGYDRKVLDAIGHPQDYSFLDEKISRLFYSDEDPETDEEQDQSMRSFWVHDVYLWIDVDGDGMAEFRHICIVGAEVLANEEVSYQPYIAMAAILLPHKHSGLSYVDVVKDLMEIKSTLWRQMLDNIYRLNVRRKYVGDAFISDVAGTLDILMDATSEIIPARDNTAITEEMVQPIVSDILPVIQGMNDMQKIRSGVAPELSLDPNVLQQSTASAFGQALDQASQRIEMVVRIFAETGFKKLFQKVHQLLRENVDIPKMLRIRGKWIEVNPADWEERTNVSVNTGLGFNRKEQKMGLIFQLIQLQKEALAIGLADPEKIHNSLSKLVDAAGLGHVGEFFVDPKSPEYKPPQPQPNPMAELAAKELDLRAKDMASKDKQAMADLHFKANEETRKNQELVMKMRELEKKLAEMTAGQALKEAQTIKTMQEARATGIENAAVERGVYDLLEASR